MTIKNSAPRKTQVPVVTRRQERQVERLIRNAPREPLLPTGHVATCERCGGDMVTTNNLTHRVATPMGLKEITRLPGAECQQCGQQALDLGAVAIIEEHKGSEVIADYETRISRAGKMPAILLKGDLPRVLRLKGKERVRWKVIDHDHAYVEIRR